jgi:hypothetical protein
MKIFLNRTIKGFKKGLFTPNLSPEMLEFNRKPIIRILRVIGGISLLSLLGRSYFELGGVLLYLSYFFSLIFLIYHIYISIHKYKYIKSVLKNKELDIKNSPLDKYASMLARVVFCAKGVCDSATPIGLGLGLMLGADQVLKDGGRDAFFGPLIGSSLNKFLPKSELEHWKDAYLEATNNLNNITKSDKVITELLNNTKDLTDITDNDKKDLLQLLNEIKQANKFDLDKAKEKAIKTLQDKSN